MDLYKTIQDLYAEKEKLERVIASLEELQQTTGSVPMPSLGGKRRGRKSMGAKEHQVCGSPGAYGRSTVRNGTRGPSGI